MMNDVPKVQRDTIEDLFKNVLGLVQESGHYGPIEEILDYALPNDRSRELSDYGFDSVAQVQWGSCEGIFVEWLLKGRFDESNETVLRVGTFKTLLTSIEAFKTMGELAGTLTFFTHEYVNAHLDRYEPIRAIK